MCLLFPPPRRAPLPRRCYLVDLELLFSTQPFRVQHGAERQCALVQPNIERTITLHGRQPGLEGNEGRGRRRGWQQLVYFGGIMASIMGKEAAAIQAHFTHAWVPGQLAPLLLKISGLFAVA